MTIRARRPPMGENTNVNPYQPRHAVTAKGNGNEGSGPEAGPDGGQAGPDGAQAGPNRWTTGPNRFITLAGFLVVGTGIALAIAAWPHNSAVPAVRQQAPAAFSPGVTAPPRVPASSRHGNATPASGIATKAGHSSGATRGAARPTVTTNPAAAGSPAVNLTAATGFGAMLRHVWVAADPGGVGLKPADVRSTMAGSVFYAGQASIGTYWAISRFVPSARAIAGARTPAGKAILAQFSKIAIFDKASGRQWAYVGDFAPGSCPTSVPGTVFTAWDLCEVGS